MWVRLLLRMMIFFVVFLLCEVIVTGFLLSSRHRIHRTVAFKEDCVPSSTQYSRIRSVLDDALSQANRKNNNGETDKSRTAGELPLNSILLPHTEMQTIGTPVGAVLLPASAVSSFHSACKAAFPNESQLRFRGVEDYDISSLSLPGNATASSGAFKAIHVSTKVAAALVDEKLPSLVAFIHHQGGYFRPGLRMRHRTRLTPKDSSQSTRQKMHQISRFTFAELFAGVGGFRLGLEPIGGACVLASEKDPIACEFYRQQFGTHDHRLIEGDVLDLVCGDFPSEGFDLLTGGFPCQPFSDRGAKLGLDDDNAGGHRGQLYLELVRILQEHQPKFFLFENVPGLVTMHGGFSFFNQTSQNWEYKAGSTMVTILNAFSDCGYKVQWHVVNAKHFSPQHRERVFIFGSRSELNCPDLNWKGLYQQSTSPKRVKDFTIRDCLERNHATNPNILASELTGKQWETIQRKCIDQNCTVEEDRKLEIDLPSVPTLISSYRNPSSDSTKLIMEEADGTIRDGNPLRPRFLTPIEFRRLMGFPESFAVQLAGTEKPSKGVDGNIYKVLGNAVVPPVIEAIGKEILCLIEELESRE